MINIDIDENIILEQLDDDLLFAEADSRGLVPDQTLNAFSDSEIIDHMQSTCLNSTMLCITYHELQELYDILATAGHYDLGNYNPIADQIKELLFQH